MDYFRKNAALRSSRFARKVKKKYYVKITLMLISKDNTIVGMNV